MQTFKKFEHLNLKYLTSNYKCSCKHHTSV